jgi:hypothetical protein
VERVVVGPVDGQRLTSGASAAIVLCGLSLNSSSERSTRVRDWPRELDVR